MEILQGGGYPLKSSNEPIRFSPEEVKSILGSVTPQDNAVLNYGYKLFNDKFPALREVAKYDGREIGQIEYYNRYSTE